MFGLTKRELAILRKLSTPAKIQDYLDRLPINHEKKGETHLSPRQVLQQKKAHCIEGALLAATALWLRGEEPLLLDLTAKAHDDDHVVALFKKNGYWGAISKTNHGVLRYRDPIYRSIRELALSYYHEYFMVKNGEKTLLSYSRPLRLKRLGMGWITSEDDLWYIAEALDELPHYAFVPRENTRAIRRATLFERKIASIREWPENHPGT